MMLVIVCAPLSVLGQEQTISGTVTDSKTGEPLIGVNVILDGKAGTTTDFNGTFKLVAEKGTHRLRFKYVGYRPLTKKVEVSQDDTVDLRISLKEKTEELDIVVVSASKYDKKLSEETVSMEVLQPELIDNANSQTSMEAVEKVPGVNVTEQQANIRGGSGWSYGAGSRVLMLVDGLPLLTADASSVKWKIVPLENIEQVEVIKGASSALYGSSALNGIINVRTAWPENEPYTKVLTYTGLYGQPPQQNMKWWDNNLPYRYGGRFAHRQRFDNFDLVVGGAFTKDQNHRQGESIQTGRFNFKTRFRPEKFEGLSFGVNGNTYIENGNAFFFWDGNDSLSYLSLPNSLTYFTNWRLRFDPFIDYIDEQGNHFSLKGRYFNATNTTTNNNQGSQPIKYHGEFEYQRNIQPLDLNLVTGASGFLSDVSSPNDNPDSSLVGNHQGYNAAGYVQLDKEFLNRLNLSFGLRYEYFAIDSFSGDSKPVIRAGANYQAAEETYLRASYGEGYRFPTMAEKFTKTTVGALGIYPNPKLEPETGWSAELGIKQGVKIGDWQGYVDAAGFINRYNNMMEFTFGRVAEDQSTSNLLGLGFSFQNIGDTRILGTELTLMGEGKIGNIPLNVLAGYTFIQPKSLNWSDTIAMYNEVGDTIRSYFDDKSYGGTASSNENYLKYRRQHRFKADVEAEIDKFSAGVGVKYFSFMQNIDRIFQSDFLIGLEGSLVNTKAFSGIRNYRDEQNGQGTWLVDARVGYNITSNTRVSFIVKNLLNEFYVERPAFPGEPRNFTLQLSSEF